jgi:protein-S-isoprenylcysteine O-methyltransferase Ste14
LTRPKSVNATWVSALGLAGFLGAVVYLGPERLPRPQFTLLCMLATAAPMIMADLLVRRVHRRHSTGLVWDRRAAGIDPGRVIVKLFGLVLTLACLAVVYWVVPEYQRKFFEPFWAALQLVGPWLVPVVIIYFGFVDARMEKPRDSYWILGALLFRRVRLADLDVEDRHELKHHALAWIIKGFYLPLMFVYLGQAIDGLAAWSLESVFTSIDRFAFFAIRLSLAVDLAFVVIGYSLMIRLIDAHTRTGNPFMYGWVFTMVLYQPFWASVGSRYFKYGDGSQWYHWMADIPALMWVWGIAIVILQLGWAWANLSFGCRFSNLTHRGIITNGPYRFTKHPSYLFKNIYWWFLAVPFLSASGPAAAVKTSLMLLGVNALYFIRSRAEEQHLSEDPVYVQYAAWINEHGIFSVLGRWFSFLRYRPPESAGSRPHGQEAA